MVGGMHGRGVHGRGHVWWGACLVGGRTWQRGACMVVGACVAGGMCGRGVCMAGRHGWWGACVAGGHAHSLMNLLDLLENLYRDKD